MSLQAVINVYRRYLSQHAVLRSPGFAITDIEGRPIGAVDWILRRQAQLEVGGWAEADHVTLSAGAYRNAVRPAAPRRARTAATGAAPNDGFRLAIPDIDEPARLQVGGAGTHAGFVLVRPHRLQRLRVLAAASLRFAVTGLRCSADALRYRLTRDEAAKARIKARLGFESSLSFRQVRPDILEPGTDRTGPAAADGPLAIVVPVHNAFEVLQPALRRILSRTEGAFRLIVVEDASTDPAVRPWLRDLAAAEADRMTLIETAANLGFVGSINLGLAEALKAPGHVVIVNSDAMLPDGWRRRLLAPILQDQGVATVTPMSNDAEIATAPVICAPAGLPEGAADRIDLVAARLNPAASLAEAPTGVGFCMALNRRFLDRLPGFDTGFGRGYGEEVDWCQKVRRMGGRHVLSGRLFVEHRGGRSFGSDEKRRRIAENNALITRRYPGYDAEVQGFIATDPLGSARLALALACLAETNAGPTPIYLAHSLGGGAERYLQTCVAGHRGAGTGVVLLRVGGNAAWQIDVVTAAGTTSGTIDTLGPVLDLLRLLPSRAVIYSCGVGATDPRDVPAALLALRGPGDRLQVLFHDYYPISPSYCLLGNDGRYRGVPDPDDPDPAHGYRSGSLRIGLPEWRAAWQALMVAADEITVFSRASAAIVAEAFPDAAAGIQTRPHSLHSDVPRCRAVPHRQGRPVVGVLGNIGFQKGARMLSEMSRRARRAPADVVVIGEFDLNYPVRGGVRVHGPYLLSDLDRLVEHYGIGCWLIPSIWPETFSYVTHEAIASGLPVFCADLGAQADAVRAAPAGHVLAADPHDALAMLGEIAAQMGWTDRPARPAPAVLEATR